MSKTQVRPLNTIDADTLMTTPMPSVQYIVDQLLPQGLHVLAGAPKVGKSWLALWLCLQVSKGEAVWGFGSTQGTVLYLCLEDSYARIQNRLFQITEDAPTTLHFANLSNQIGGGLEAQIKEFLEKHPGTNLVVIDTLQKVRSGAGEANPYANDYRDLSVLKALADQHRIAIVLIHHLRKMGDEDPLNMISGTTGISGAADSSSVLKPAKRGSKTAVLYCTGRDIEYRELPLEFRKETYTGELTEPVEVSECQLDPQVVFLSEFLFDLSAFDGSATELSVLLEKQTGEKVTPAALAKRLVRYSGELNRIGIRITSSRTRDSRLIHIRCDGSDGNDGKNDTGPVSNFLSQPSQLSQGASAAQ